MVTCLSSRLKAPDSVIENVCQALRNKRTFGASTWYEWSIENWGTKWNAYSTSQYGNAIAFDTAWSMPDPIFRALSARYPKLTFRVDYAEGDIGSNCGTCVYNAGQLVEEIEPAEPRTFALSVIGQTDDLDDISEVAA